MIDFPVLVILSYGAEGRAWRHKIIWIDAQGSFTLERFKTHIEAQTYAASVYDGLGAPGYYRGATC